MDRMSCHLTRCAAVALIAWVSAGSPVEALDASPATVSATKVRNDAEGAEVLGHLRKRYAEDIKDCGSAGAPALLCSGIMLRGTNYSPDYKAWVPNPKSPKAPGVSFSFLRKDAKYSKLAYNYVSGFIIYPNVYVPVDATLGLVRPEVLCIFPIDAATDFRQERGCGQSQNYPNESKACYQMGVYTEEQWYQHYLKGSRLRNYNAHNYQCGFDISKSRQANINKYFSGLGLKPPGNDPGSAAQFNAALQAMRKLGNESFEEQNEIILQGWGDTPNKIGVEAFFYVSGSDEGKQIAKNNQADFYTTLKALNAKDPWRPIIRISLPQSKSFDATFTYDPTEQYVPR